MQTMVPLYGFGGGSGGTGAALTVNAPAGCTVTVSKDGKTKTKTAGADGVAVFKGLATGEWTIVITDGEQVSPTKTVTITADYSTAITFFAATIHVTYPAGSICTATDGVTTLTAPDTSGTWVCELPNAGTWKVSTDLFVDAHTIDVTSAGGTYDITISPVLLYADSAEDDITRIWGTYNNSILSKTSNGYKIDRNGSDNPAGMCLKTPLNVSSYSAVKAEVISGSGNINLYFNNQFGADNVLGYTASYDSGTLALNVESLVDAVYIGLGPGASVNAWFTVKKVWLE